MSYVGITWGLPSRKIDKFLFAESDVWPGEKIYRLAKAGEKFSAHRTITTGADVDVDPLDSNREILPSPQPARLRGEGDMTRQEPRPPLLLTGTEEDVAKIYLRYRLYTYQPDEMITMMALAGMRPRELQFDPRLYQYGGLFIYPVGAFIKLCGMLGLIDVRSDLVLYLDHPDEFGKFYVVARAYSAAWGLLGVVVVFALTRRLAVEVQGSKFKVQVGDANSYRDGQIRPASGELAGLFAALLFALMPVVVCMSHEGKPHLPGAVLMLLAVYFAVRAVDGESPRLVPSSTEAGISNLKSRISDKGYFWLLCICCGAAVGMVLSSWPISSLIPLTAIIQHRRWSGSSAPRREGTGRWSDVFKKTLLGGGVAIAVYLMTNPYVLINLFVNREVLRSNFGNSLAMYEIARVAQGFNRVLQLIGEGASWPVAALGLAAIFIGVHQYARLPQLWLILVPVALFFLQFVLIGAGKPAEYGRFGIFPDAVLAIGAAILLGEMVRSRLPGLGWLFLVAGFGGVLYFGGGYLRGFHMDTTDRSSRLVLARQILEMHDTSGIALGAEPAPYSCPPLRFASTKVWHLSKSEKMPVHAKDLLLIDPINDSISWANKKFLTSRTKKLE